MSGFKTKLALCTLLSVSAFGLVACSHDKMSDSSMNTSGMSADDMVKKGDDMIIMGRGMKDHAAAMKDGDMMDGMSKGDMMMKGDKMIQDGMAMKQKGMDMKAHGM